MKNKLTFCAIFIFILSNIIFAQTTRNVPSDYATIQAAITAAVDGDVIHIAAGVYDNDLTTLTVNKSLTFTGEGPASSPTTIITSTASRIITLSVTGKSFSFQNLIVEGNTSNNGIYAGSSVDIASLSMQDVVLRNCQVGLYLAENYPGTGPVTTTVSSLSFDNVTLTNNKFIGAYIGKTVLSGTVANSTITGNGYSSDLPASWQKVGLQFVNFDEASVPHVEITNCYFYNNGAGASDIERTGLSMYTGYNVLSANQLMIVSGSSFINHHWAVRIKDGSSVGNTATVDGTFSGNDLDIWFNSVIGTSTSTTLIRRTFPGIRTVGAGTMYDYNTIQAAITAAATGEVIQVAAGTYNEDVNVNKTLTVTGAGASTTSIVATNANTTPLTFSCSGSTVSGFTITHNYTPAELSSWSFNNNGVTFSGLANSGNTLTQCTVTLNRNGIYFNNSHNIVSNNTITNNRTGINMTGTIDGTQITGNTISDNWTIGLVTYYLSNVANYSNVTVTGNTFTNNWYTEVLIKDASASSGILDVSSNTFSDSPVTYSFSSDLSLNEPAFADQRPVALGGTATQPVTTLPTLRIYNSGSVALKYDPVKTVLVRSGQSIQAGITLANAGDVVSIADGTYAETLNITKANLTIRGNLDALDNVVINAGGLGGYGSPLSAIYCNQPGVVLEGFTLVGGGQTTSTNPRYGINISGITGATVRYVVLQNFSRTALNVPSCSNLTFDHITAFNNGGNGLGLRDITNAAISNITTNNNLWGGIRLQTYNGSISGITISGTNNFGENGSAPTYLHPLYLEQGNVNPAGPPFPITYGYSGTHDVIFQSADFGYLVSGDDDEAPQYQRIHIYKTKANAEEAAASPDVAGDAFHLTTHRYIKDIATGEFVVPTTLGIHDAIDAASDGDVINIDPGTYPHLVIDKPVTLNGNGAIITNASPAITINVSNVTVTGFTFVFNDNTIPYDDYAIDVQNNATNVVIHDCNFQNMLNGGNGNGVINRGTGTVDATLNYWNSITGPTISSNPLGTGRIATNSGGGILYYTPWYGDLAHTTTNLEEAVLLTPSNLSTGITILPIFSWQPVSALGATYQLEIATDISFAAPTIVYGPVAVTSPYQLPESNALNNSTIYYWRITTSVGLVSSQSIGNFTTIAPALPILTYPGNLSTILGNIIYFSWYSGVQGILYRIEFSQFNDFHAMISGFPTVASTSTNYNLAYNYSTLPSGEYYWRVKSYTSLGVLTNISPTWSFLISGAPTVAPTYPVGGTTVYSSNPTLWWMPINYSYTSGIYYRVRYSTDHSYGLQTAPTTNLFTTLSGLSAGQTYYYVVDASTSSTDWSAATTSIEESFTVYYSTVANITVFQSYPISGQEVYTDMPTLYWYIGMYIPGITFDVEYFDGSWHSLGSVANYYYTFTSSLPAGIYSWRVRVHGGTTWYTETFSINSFSSSTLATIPIPFSPTGGMIVSSQSPSLIWLAYSTSALEYQVIYSSDPTLTGGVLTYTSAPNGGSSGWLVTNSYGLTGLTPGVTYYWQVRSRLAATPATISNYSTVAQFTVSPGASPVVVIPANPIVGTNINSSAANLSWIIPAMSSSTLKYDLELSKYPDMKSPLIINDLSEPSYKIENLDLNSTYYWRVKSKTIAGLVSNNSAIGSFTTGEVTSVELGNIIPTQFELQQNYPNPFNPTTRITYSIPKNAFVSLKIYDMLGKEVKTLVSSEMNTGVYTIDWKGDNQFGNKVTSGMYIYRITAGNFVATKKMMLIK